MFARRLVAVLLSLSLLLYLTFHLSLPQPNEPARLYCNQCQDDLTRLMERAIDGATDSIHLLMYNLSSPHLIAALERKRYQGVDVVVVADAREAKRLRNRLDPAVTLIPRPAAGLMHQKVLVIDRRQVWIGSANWTPSSLRSHTNLILGMEAPELSRFLSESAVSRLDGSPPPLPHRRAFDVGGQQVEYWQLPSDERALPRLIGLIDGAKESVRVALFTWTHPELTEAVIRAHQRGVSVRAVIDGYSGAGSSRRTVERLQEAGVKVRLSMGPELLHHKLLWIDDIVLVTGSANWTKAAFAENDDAFLVLYPLTARQQRKVRSLWRATWVEGTTSLH